LKFKVKKPTDMVTIPGRTCLLHAQVPVGQTDRLPGPEAAVRVVRRNGRLDCLISFSLGNAAPVDRTSPMGGIDLNPEVAAVTVALPC